MKVFIHFALFLAVTQTIAKPHHTSQDSFREKVVAGDLPAEYLDALKKFSEKAVSTPSFDISNAADRAIFADPLSLGYLYAILNEQSVFDVENADIVKALQVSQEEIPKVFAALINRLNQDQDSVATNAVFTKNPDLNVTDALTALRSYRETLQLVDNPKAVPTINNYLADHTKNLIREQLLPAEDAFYNSTQAVVVNTLYLSKKLRTPFSPVGQRKFQYGKSAEEFHLVDTLELNDAQNQLRVLSDKDYSAVLIPLSGEAGTTGKSLVLVKPRECLGSFLKNNVKDIFQPDFISKLVVSTGTGTGVRVQVPVLNFTLAREFSTEYERTKKIPSFTSAICDTATEHQNFLQRIVQVSRIILSGETLEVGEAVGVSVENVKQYRKEFGAGDGASSNVDLTNNGNGPSASDPNLSGGAKTKYNKNDYISITEGPSGSQSRSELTNMNKHQQMVAETEPEPEAEAEPTSASASAPRSKAILDVVEINVRPTSLTKENQQHLPNAGVANKNEKIIPVLVQEESELLNKDKMTNKNKQSLKSGAGDSVNTENDFVFNSPFFAFIHDESLGPIQFLAVRDVSLPDQDVASHIISENFSEFSKLQRYVCIAPPAPFLPPAKTTNVNVSDKNKDKDKKKYQQHYQH